MQLWLWELSEALSSLVKENFFLDFEFTQR